METYKVKSHIVQLYNSIKELPISKSIQYKQYLLQDMGIGDDIADVDDHLEKLFLLNQRNEQEHAMIEAKNLRFNFFNMLAGVDLKSMSVACLVYSIDNTVFKSPEDAQKRLQEIDVTGGELDEWHDTVKKNLILRDNYISPSSLLKSQLI